jgi:two-component system response regulator PilR (NtrC family)
MESEMFGHKKGAFTGAAQEKKGLFEVAHNGTLFLDEIGEISMPIQVKLLRAVQEKSFKMVGGNEDISVDVRIISATNKDLEKEVIEGHFREDLFYRLNVIEIKMPPLRERKEDLRPLAQHFLEKYAKEMGKEITKISSYAIDLLKKYDFPGNIRELENLIERSVALTSTNILLPDSLALSTYKRKRKEDSDRSPNGLGLEAVEKGVQLDEIIADIERSYLRKALDVAGGEKKKAAELLGINLRSFRYRLDKLEVGG